MPRMTKPELEMQLENAKARIISYQNSENEGAEIQADLVRERNDAVFRAEQADKRREMADARLIEALERTNDAAIWINALSNALQALKPAQAPTYVLNPPPSPDWAVPGPVTCQPGSADPPNPTTTGGTP